MLKNMSVLKTDDLMHYYVSEEAVKFLTDNNGDIFMTMDKGLDILLPDTFLITFPAIG